MFELEMNEIFSVNQLHILILSGDDFYGYY